MEIKIQDIEQLFVDGIFESYRVTYAVYVNGKYNKTVRRYIYEELSYLEVLSFIEEKELKTPLRELKKALQAEDEFESEKEIIQEEEKEFTNEGEF